MRCSDTLSTRPERHHLQAGDNLPLYGVCCYMEEAVQQPPWLLQTGPRAPLPLAHTIPVAPRCYCLLTHYPFFTLHFKVSASIAKVWDV